MIIRPCAICETKLSAESQVTNKHLMIYLNSELFFFNNLNIYIFIKYSLLIQDTLLNIYLMLNNHRTNQNYMFNSHFENIIYRMLNFNCN